MDHNIEGSTYKWIVLLLLMTAAAGEDPQVVIGNVTIVGKKAFYTGFEADEFLGIPYAKPPTGNLRFRKSEPLDDWFSRQTTFNATNFGSTCYEFQYSTQSSVLSSEDCLFLNVFVPVLEPNNTSGHAVMIWIHGGDFQSGSSNPYIGSVLASYGNIIVVTINYRLGVFGFLSTGDENGPGNYGLWDQQSAFKWVYNNIRHFGGDINRITIAGESAGAISVILHGLNPENKDLFQRIIAQSGSPSLPAYDLERNVLENTKTIAKNLQCITSSTSELMNCLRAKNVDEINTASSSLSDSLFVPVVDRDFIKVNPRYISKSLQNAASKEVEFFQSVDLLSGINAYEGTIFLHKIFSQTNQENLVITSAKFREYLSSKMQISHGQDVGTEIVDMILAEYTNWTRPADNDSVRLQFVKLLGDINVGAPCIEMTRLHSKSSDSKTYLYHFTPKLVSYHSGPAWLPGAAHGDELNLTLGNVHMTSSASWERTLSNQTMTYWTNFVKGGDPGIASGAPQWPKYEPNTEMYLELEETLTETSVKQYLLAREYNFWLKVFPGLLEAREKANCRVSTDATTNRVSAATTMSLGVFNEFLSCTVIVVVFRKLV